MRIDEMHCALSCGYPVYVRYEMADATTGLIYFIDAWSEEYGDVTIDEDEEGLLCAFVAENHRERT